MNNATINFRTPLTIAALTAMLALAACGKKVEPETMPSTPANTAPAVTAPMPDTSASAPMGGASPSMGSTDSSSSMSNPSMPSGMTTPTPGAATGSVPGNDGSPAAVAPASAASATR